MKHSLSFFLALVSLSLVAQDVTYSAAEQKDIAKRLGVAQSLVRKQQYLLAMDSATYALAMYERAYSLRNFVRKHWEQAMGEAQDHLDTLLEQNNLRQCRERVRIYTYLVDINDNLNAIPLPLYGKNNQWMWQPDMQYWAGHLAQEERQLYALEEQELARQKREEAERLKAEQADRPVTITPKALSEE